MSTALKTQQMMGLGIKSLNWIKSSSQSSSVILRGSFLGLWDNSFVLQQIVGSNLNSNHLVPGSAENLASHLSTLLSGPKMYHSSLD